MSNMTLIEALRNSFFEEERIYTRKKPLRGLKNVKETEKRRT